MGAEQLGKAGTTMNQSRQLLASIVAFGQLALFGAACSSPKTSTTSSTTGPTAAAAQAYLAAANPLNGAITTFGSQATKWSAQTTDSQARARGPTSRHCLAEYAENLPRHDLADFSAEGCRLTAARRRIDDW